MLIDASPQVIGRQWCPVVYHQAAVLLWARCSALKYIVGAGLAVPCMQLPECRAQLTTVLLCCSTYSTQLLGAADAAGPGRGGGGGRGWGVGSATCQCVSRHRTVPYWHHGSAWATG